MIDNHGDNSTLSIPHSNTIGNKKSINKEKKTIRIRSQGEKVEIDNQKINRIADHLGIYLAKEYWHSILDPCTYTGKGVGRDAVSRGKMIAHLRNRHFTGNSTFLFRRAFSYERYGERFEPAQKIVCFDIDGHRSEDTQAAVRFLLSMFPEEKYIEYSHASNSYHVYYEFDRPIFDYALNSLAAFFKDKGYNIDPIVSTEHMRFPFSFTYNCYGLYDPKEEICVRRMDIDTLLCFWNEQYQNAYFDPTFEVVEKVVSRSPIKSNAKTRGIVTSGDLMKALLEDPAYDYREGERYDACNRILAKVIHYRLTEHDFEELCRSHDKGARGKTDYSKLYEWGLKRWGHQALKPKKVDYSRIIEGVLHYAGDVVLPDNVLSSLRVAIDQSLLAFLKTSMNLCKSGTFKNDRLMRSRYGKQVEEFLLFLYRYEVAKRREISFIRGNQPQLLLPLVFQHTVKGIPLPQTLIKFLGKHYHRRAFPEIKTYLVSIGWLRAIPIGERGQTYAEGVCIHYRLMLPEKNAEKNNKT